MPYTSALTAAQEGRGFNSYLPMPFVDTARFEVVDVGDAPIILYYQIDYTFHPDRPEGLGLLHASFRSERTRPRCGRTSSSPPACGDPGRFLGCNVGVRVIDACAWWGEGETKVYRDGDEDFPTISGTGLEDYIGSAWGLGAHAAPYGGAPLLVQRPAGDGSPAAPNTDYVGFYRWHMLDPITFEREPTVTIQQIGAMAFRAGEQAALEAYERTNPVAGRGWIRDLPAHLLAWGWPSASTTAAPPPTCTASSRSRCHHAIPRSRSPTSPASATRHRSTTRHGSTPCHRHPASVADGGTCSVPRAPTRRSPS